MIIANYQKKDRNLSFKEYYDKKNEHVSEHSYFCISTLFIESLLNIKMCRNIGLVYLVESQLHII